MTQSMQNTLKWEEFGHFILSIFLFSRLDFSWWIYPALLFLPDISILAYLISPRIGAIVYNLFHHKLPAILLFAVGSYLQWPIWTLFGIIFFGHSSMDRILGYGLKYADDFRHTHLGWIGKKRTNVT